MLPQSMVFHRAPGAPLPLLQEVPVPQLRGEGSRHAGPEPLADHVSLGSHSRCGAGLTCECCPLAGKHPSVCC